MIACTEAGCQACQDWQWNHLIIIRHGLLRAAPKSSRSGTINKPSNSLPRREMKLSYYHSSRTFARQPKSYRSATTDRPTNHQLLTLSCLIIISSQVFPRAPDTKLKKCNHQCNVQSLEKVFYLWSSQWFLLYIPSRTKEGGQRETAFLTNMYLVSGKEWRQGSLTYPTKRILTTSFGYFMNITEYVIVYCHFIHWHPTILGGKGETISTATHYQSPHIECTMYNFSTFINGRKP